MSKVIGKMKTGVSGAVTSPTRFIVSLGIGFVIGVIADWIMEYIQENFGAPFNAIEIQTPGFKPYIGLDYERIAGDDVALIVITILLLFTRKFVTTLGFFLGWYISSIYGFYGGIFKTVGD